jgi:hypothetical protein
MSFHSWLQNLRSALTPNRGRRHPRRRGSLRAGAHRISLELLEDRLTPSFGWDGAYYSVPPPGVVPAPQPPLLADFTSDGIPDQLSVNFVFYELRIRPGRGDGTFGNPIISGIYSPNGAQLGVADFNDDGRLDVFVCSNADWLGRIMGDTLLGRGDGSFESVDFNPLDFNYPFERPVWIGTKINFDTGRRDVVIAGGNNVDYEITYVVLFNNGDWSPKTYVGPTGGNWSTASNWSPSGAPTAADSVFITGTSVNLSASATVASLTLSGGGSLTVSQSGNRVLRTTALSIVTGSILDLKDNDLIVDYTGGSPIGSWNGAAYTGITGLLQSGRNGGGWNGSGIVTSSASGNLTTLGIAEINGDVLVKFTYGGDANLDGKLNILDYVQIDQGIMAQLTGWSNGDCNYDGKINIGDYVIIDSNIRTQGVPFAGAAVASTYSGAAITGLGFVTPIGLQFHKVEERDEATIDLLA